MTVLMFGILLIIPTNGIQAQTDNSTKKTEKSSKIVLKQILPSTDTRHTSRGKDIDSTNHISDTIHTSDTKRISDTIHNGEKTAIPVLNIRVANQIFMDYNGVKFELAGKDAIIEDQNSQLIRKQLDLDLLEEANKYKDSLLISNQVLHTSQEKYFEQEIREIKKKSWIPWGVAFITTLLLGISL